MPWVKLSDDWYDDDKLAGADPAVLATWAVGISWCARNLTDGLIPRGEHRRLVNLYDTFDSEGQQVHPDRIAEELVERGAWQIVARGYEVVNYHRYQPTRENVLAEREAAKQRAAKSRAAKASAYEDSCDERAAHVRPNFERSASSPVPVPDESSSSSSSVTETGLPDDLWMKIAERQAQTTTSRIANPSAWKRKAAKNAEADLSERAESLVANYDLSTSKLVDVLLSPSNPQWLSHYRKQESA